MQYTNNKAEDSISRTFIELSEAGFICLDSEIEQFQHRHRFYALTI
jgi:hypothetical protein